MIVLVLSLSLIHSTACNFRRIILSAIFCVIVSLVVGDGECHTPNTELKTGSDAQSEKPEWSRVR